MDSFPDDLRYCLHLLIVPGGVFHFVSTGNGGYDLARALAIQGIDGFALKDRLSS